MERCGDGEGDGAGNGLAAMNEWLAGWLCGEVK
jgi:hypothetical protein